MNPLFSIMIIVLVVFVAIALVLSFSRPVVELSEETVGLKEAENAMEQLDSFILETSREGSGALRTVRTSFSGSIDVIPEEDALQYQLLSTTSLIDHFSRILSGNLMTIAGNDVDCQTETNLVMENTYLRVEFQNVATEGNIFTANNILSLKEKTSNEQISFLNSSILIDGNQSSSSGTGYSEILSSGSNLPVCIVHFYVNSTPAVYDAYYSLYAGADFLVLEVRNVR